MHSFRVVAYTTLKVKLGFLGKSDREIRQGDAKIDEKGTL